VLLGEYCVFAASERINIATATTGGTYYPGGIALAQLWQEKGGVMASATTSAGSIENIDLLMSGEANVVAIQSNVLQYAYEGVDVYQDKAKPELRILIPNFTQPYQFLIREGAELKGIRDWQGKRVVTGRAGSGTYITHVKVFEALGFTVNDVKQSNLGQNEAVDAMRNGLCDASILMGIVPLAPIADALAAPGTNIKLYSLSNEERKAILDRNVWMSPMTIPRNSYIGLLDDVQTIGHIGYWVVREDFPEELAYRLVKTAYENTEWLKTAYSGYGNLSFLNPAEGILRMPVPAHPGAMKYYKEVGFMK
jgi:TRAP transporter TAXI family solute receptor